MFTFSRGYGFQHNWSIFVGDVKKNEFGVDCVRPLDCKKKLFMAREWVLVQFHEALQYALSICVSKYL